MQSTIGITSGDPSGIGLEVVLKALPATLTSARWVLFTDAAAFERHYVRFGGGIPYRWISGLEEADDAATLHLVEVPGAHCPIPWGDIQPAAGERALAYLTAAAGAALRGEIAGIVTAPVHKAAIGGSFRGQTEFLAEQARTPRVAMSFFTPTFKVVLATVHVSLREALEKISAELYVDLIHLVADELGRFGFRDLSIAVAAINPHAGEDGMFGREELDVLAPAVAQCARAGIRVFVIAPYHDQGLAPVKLIAHGQATNVTLGLPFVRTSPDHGTALSIAGKGLADPSGMISAMKCAVELCGKSG
jgi:4-hydroxythreonine-4-phosphate dehydrogenase